MNRPKITFATLKQRYRDIVKQIDQQQQDIDFIMDMLNKMIDD